MAAETNQQEQDGSVLGLDSETVLDVLVNVVPMVILLFFIVLYTLIRPWQFDASTFVIMHFLTVFPFLLLGILTYYAAQAISRDEAELERERTEGT